MAKPKKRDAETAARVRKTARITGASYDYIYRVIRGDRQSDFILGVYMELLENDLKIENRLIDAVKELVPFDNH